jgi:hypothetical protein
MRRTDRDVGFGSLTEVTGWFISVCYSSKSGPRGRNSDSARLALHFLCAFEPFLVGAGHFVAVFEYFEQGRIVFFFEPGNAGLVFAWCCSDWIEADGSTQFAIGVTQFLIFVVFDFSFSLEDSGVAEVFDSLGHGIGEVVIFAVGKQTFATKSAKNGLMPATNSIAIQSVRGAGVALLGRLALTVAQNLGIAAERIHDCGGDKFDTR